MECMTKYAALCRKADRLFSSIRQSYHGVLQCRDGCCRCCTLSSVLAIEAFVLAGAIRNLDTGKRERISAQAKQQDLATCPLLLDDLCTVYASRPLICRTHGAPLAYIDYVAETVEISACPVNFPAGSPIDTEKLLSMDELNAELQDLNRQFISSRGGSSQRIALGDVVRNSAALPSSSSMK